MAAFYLIYVREAHAADGNWPLAVPTAAQPINEPKTEDERHDVATQCVKDLKIDLPTLIDGMDNKVERAYSAWPDRIYIVDKAGKIAYKGAPGPRGFKVSEAQAALETLLR